MFPCSGTARMQVGDGAAGAGGGEQSQDSLPTQSGNSDFEPGGCCGSFRKLEMLQEARGADLGGRERAVEARESIALCCAQRGRS